MRRSWIKIETATPDKPEICIIATELKMDPDTVMGKLVRLWSWAEVNRVQDGRLSVTPEFLDKVVGKKGFSAALVQAGWLIFNDKDLFFPNFNRHNGKLGRIRAQTAERVNRHRQSKRNSNDLKDADSLANEVLEADEPSQKPFKKSGQKSVKSTDKTLVNNGSNGAKKGQFEGVVPEVLPEEAIVEPEAHEPAEVTDVNEPPAGTEAALPASSGDTLADDPADRQEEVHEHAAEAQEENEESVTRRRAERPKRIPDDPAQPMLF